jgi:hemolysin activation/secretion protein
MRPVRAAAAGPWQWLPVLACDGQVVCPLPESAPAASVIANHERNNCVCRRPDWSLGKTEVFPGGKEGRDRFCRERHTLRAAGSSLLGAMQFMNSSIVGRQKKRPARRPGPFIFCLIVLAIGWLAGNLNVKAAESAAQPGLVESNSVIAYHVTAITVSGNIRLSTNVLTRLFAKYAGGRVTLEQLAEAATDLQAEYRKEGYPMISVAFSPASIDHGIVTFNVIPTAVPQIVVSGVRYLGADSLAEVAANFLPAHAVATNPPTLASSSAPTNSPAVTNVPPPVFHPRATPDTPEELAAARAAMLEKMAELEAQAKDKRVHVVSTNAGPRFAVNHYLIAGNTVLSPQTMSEVLTNIDGDYGTNVSFDGVLTAVKELQRAYSDRGFVTVAVGLPQQKLTNATVKVQVTEGRLADIVVKGNRYFSTENVLRALPSLHTNMLLNGPIFQAELNRANANQDRQIYPVIGPGPEPGTSALTLKVKDQLPLHAKVEFNNQSSPGTPDLRLNASAMADNLWQREQSLGVQYGFSPEQYKAGNQWNFYDQPTVAYYSAFYRLPLGNPQAIADTVANNSGFGYNEATRQFNLPPPTGQPELTLYANRATIDTGVQSLPPQTLGTNNLTEQNTHQDLTINEGIGFQLAKPLPEMDGVRSFLSGGLDFKIYDLTSYATNSFSSSSSVTNSGTVYTTENTVISPIPTTHSTLNYLPLALNYSANFQDAAGPATFGLGLSVNLWYASTYSTIENSSSTTYSTNAVTGGIITNTVPTTTTTSLHGEGALQSITHSTESSGHWAVLRPSFSQEIDLVSNWPTLFRADGQWASEPLISNEQFGAGGVNSVRGYHEGEVFGDTGWHMTLEQQTPFYTVGMIRDGTPLTLRGSAYMDYARVYLIDPQGRQAITPLWGTGFGFSASAGSHWQAQFLFSWPLISTATTVVGEPFFNFALTGQF